MPISVELHDNPDQSTRPAIAHMAFGANTSGAVVHQGLQPLIRKAAHELWYAGTPEAHGQNGAITWTADSSILFGSGSVRLADDAVDATCNLYHDVFTCARQQGFPHLLRVWHYLPRINDGAGDGEHYKRFCLGRAKAFDQWFDTSEQPPAGTAIGTLAGDELLVYFLASRIPGKQIENPRQISAFDYPRRYGPRQPLFSRAMVWSQGNSAKLIVSGTASIVGHESRHPNDLQGQLHEMWQNLECLRESAGATRPLILRVYVRRADDYPVIRDFLSERLPADVSVLYLHADICRAELLVEIEGLYDMPPGNTMVDNKQVS